MPFNQCDVLVDRHLHAIVVRDSRNLGGALRMRILQANLPENYNAILTFVSLDANKYFTKFGKVEI